MVYHLAAKENISHENMNNVKDFLEFEKNNNDKVVLNVDIRK